MAVRAGSVAELLGLTARWQQLDDLLAAAGSMRGDASCHNRRCHAVSSLVVCARMEMVAAFLAQRSRRPGIALMDEVRLTAVVLCGQTRH